MDFYKKMLLWQTCIIFLIWNIGLVAGYIINLFREPWWIMTTLTGDYIISAIGVNTTRFQRIVVEFSTSHSICL